MTRADLGKDPDDVSRMFDRVAKRYDLLNDLLSLGQTKRWRKKVSRIISPKRGEQILDIAAGTGTSSAALALPFADDEFDITTISFGLRNTNDTSRALSEALRVTKPGGRIYVVEFSHPRSKIFRTIYFKYLLRALPPIAKRFSSNPDAYIYLAESIMAWPNQRDLAALMTGSGWEEVSWRDLTAGVVAVHIGRKRALISAT
ncbi:MAG: class I SAM-dependent methyltransferase [Actinomycetota bacterium]